MNIYSQITANKLRSMLIIGIFMAMLSGFFYLMGQFNGDGAGYLLFGFGISLVTGFSSYFYSDKLVLTMAGAKPASKEEYFDYYTVTENLAIAAGIPMPKLYVIHDEAPNAFATGRNPQHAVVAASTGLLKRLDRSEIEGVIAHELSHIRNYDILVMTIVSVLVGTVAYAVDFATRMMWFGGGSSNDDRDSKSGLIGVALMLVLIIVMPIVATLIQFAVSRKREYLADASGALLTRNPEGLASALVKIAADSHQMKHATPATAHMYISNPFKKGTRASNWLTNLFSTHPPVEERIRILREMA